VAKRWPTPAVALIPTTVVGIAAIVSSIYEAYAPCNEGGLCGLVVIYYVMAAFAYVASWPVSLFAIWLLRKFAAAQGRGL
jgi:hypothetical protein